MRNVILLAFLYIAATGCSKKNSPPAPDDDNLTPDQISFRKILDTTAAYSHLFYLWTDNLPDNYSYSHTNLGSFMSWLRSFSTEPGFTKPVDRWSFSMPQSQWDDVSGGIAGDFGFDVLYLDYDDLRIINVDKNGPGAARKLHRGYRIKEINGSSNVSYANVNAVANAIYNSTSITIKVGRESAADTTVTVAVAGYTQNPFALDSVYTINSHKIGYLVYNSFLGDTTFAINNFATIFNKFANENVQDIVLDFRYNGGGYTKLSNELSNYLVPSGHDGEVLNQDVFSRHSSEYNRTVNVQKKGTVNLSKLYVITSANTASASEALINSLSSYLDITIIGDTSHGKPVGYFPIPVADQYIFPVSIRTVNKSGTGNYFNGFAPQHLEYDGIEYNWGNVQEYCLKRAINLITGTGNTRVDNAAQAHKIATMQLLNKKLTRTTQLGSISELSKDKIQQLKQTIHIKD